MSFLQEITDANQWLAFQTAAGDTTVGSTPDTVYSKMKIQKNQYVAKKLAAFSGLYPRRS
jgi:hypothetical protein